MVRSFGALRATLIALNAAVILSACGGSGGGGSSPAGSETPSPTVTPTSSSSPTPSPTVTVTPTSTATATPTVTVTPTPTPTPTPAIVGGTWELVWQDEFEGTELNLNKWERLNNCWGGGNNELQCYTNREDNSFVDSGMLTILAREETYEGPVDSEGQSPSTRELDYTSARLRTKNVGEWTFGRFEARIKVPSADGVWPAFWMLPTDSIYGGWPYSGEIDIVETAGVKVDFGGAIHFGGANRQFSSRVTRIDGGPRPGEDFHIFAAEWDQNQVRWYVDGREYGSVSSEGWYSDAAPGDPFAPFDANNQFHLILNLAVGGNFPGVGTPPPGFEEIMEVDWVRVYECQVDGAVRADGLGCDEADNPPENQEVGTVPDPVRPSPTPEPTADPTIIAPPSYMVYDDALSMDLGFSQFQTGVNYSEVAEGERGNVLTIIRTGTGNVALGNDTDALAFDMTAFSPNGELVFDVRINDVGVDGDGNPSVLRVRMDTAWPNVSDHVVTGTTVGEWQEYRINIQDMIDSGNELGATYGPENEGNADLSFITLPLVVEPSGDMSVSFDNIRFEVPIEL